MKKLFLYIFLIFLSVLNLPVFSTFSCSGTIITVTGTETSLANLEGTSGCGTDYIYSQCVGTGNSEFCTRNIYENQLLVQGTLTINPESEIVISDHENPFLVTTGTLTFGEETTSGSKTDFSQGLSLRSTKNQNPFSGTSSTILNPQVGALSIQSLGSFNWYGGLVIGPTGFFFAQNSNIEISNGIFISQNNAPRNVALASNGGTIDGTFSTNHHGGGEGTGLIDGQLHTGSGYPFNVNPSTIYHSRYDPGFGPTVDKQIRINFSQEYSISEIRIYNREDCCSNRVNGQTLNLRNSLNTIVYTQILSDSSNPIIFTGINGINASSVELIYDTGNDKVINLDEIEVLTQVSNFKSFSNREFESIIASENVLIKDFSFVEGELLSTLNSENLSNLNREFSQFGYSPQGDGLKIIRDSSFNSDSNVIDVAIHSSNYPNLTQVKVINPEFGTDLTILGKIRGSSNLNVGNVEIVKEFYISAFDSVSLSPLESVKYYIQDSNNGVRKNINGINDLEDKIYINRTNSSGISPVDEVVLGIVNVGTAPNTQGTKNSGEYSVDLRGNTNTLGDDLFDISFWKYGYEGVSYLNRKFTGTGTLNIPINLRRDPQTVLSETVVSQISTIDINHTSKTISISSPTTLNILYDYASYDKTLNENLNKPTPFTRAVESSKEILDLNGYSISVETGGTLIRQASLSNPFTTVENTTITCNGGTIDINFGSSSSSVGC